MIVTLLRPGMISPAEEPELVGETVVAALMDEMPNCAWNAVVKVVPAEDMIDFRPLLMPAAMDGSRNPEPRGRGGDCTCRSRITEPAYSCMMCTWAGSTLVEAATCLMTCFLKAVSSVWFDARCG